jgi:hypothetical protein
MDSFSNGSSENTYVKCKLYIICRDVAEKFSFVFFGRHGPEIYFWAMHPS